MAEDSDLEKTESPSPRRLEQAREDGRAPHSRELASFSVLLAAGVGLAFLGQDIMAGLRADVVSGLMFDHSLVEHPDHLLERLGHMSTAAMFGLLPWLGLVFAAAVVAPLTLSGFLFTPGNIMPDFSRLSPARGLGNILSSSGLAELGKAILKAVLIGGLGGWFLWTSRGAALGLGHSSFPVALEAGVHLLQRCVYVLLAGLGVVVAIDVPFQIWHFHDGLKMTREELRQEARESDGDPHVKARIRQQQRESARRRMMSEVPGADVVVTNPTHYAVALRYEQGAMRAPRVVAKGGDLVALRIRGLAEAHGVPILEQPPLARALFKHAELEREIPPGLYAAVAEVLAYVFQLRAWRDGSGGQPTQPRTVEVPAELAVAAAVLPAATELQPRAAAAAAGLEAIAATSAVGGGVAGV
ncbi:MAG: flagellar type III secretion system protein FlhB [Pseudomonadota bacterium]|nr:flagellar type III secretion system protein FlhB [Pseudomonadota bacterium]